MQEPRSFPRSARLLPALALLLSLSPSPARAQSPPPAADTARLAKQQATAADTALPAMHAAAPPAPSDSAAATPAHHAPVVLQPGDKVRLKVWREPDLSGDFAVDENGVAVFPHIGRLVVSRLSTDSLQALLISRYAGSLRDPAVEVTVLRRVSVLGSVRSPGLFYVDPTITVADLLALAGGVSPEGNQKRMDLVRGGERLEVHLTQRSSLADTFVEPGDQLWVPERSWLSRNTWFLSAGITGAALVIAALLKY